MKTLFISSMIILCLGHLSVAQIGGVGINVQVPRAMLHVGDSSVLFTAPSEMPVNPGPTPVTGGGNRMMWYADKAAFRVGGVEDTNWDRDSIGQFSFATGTNSKAPGLQSFATGYNTTASGQGSFATGAYTKASGGWATSFGAYSQATAYTAFASGQNCIASETSASAFGVESNASGYASLAGGFNSQATGGQSVALNTSTSANGHSSTSLGLWTIANGMAGVSIGVYNAPLLSTGTDQLLPETPLFIVGNGTSFSARQNAMVIRYDGKTGIGTDAPQSLLHVAAAQTNSILGRFTATGAGYGEIVIENGNRKVDLGIHHYKGYVGTKDSADFTIRTGTTNRMEFSHATGHVGIGCVASHRLDVYHPVQNAQVARFRSLGGFGEIVVGNSQYLMDMGVYNAHGYVGTKDSIDFSIRTGAIPRIVAIHNSGYVGIGTTSPQSRLQVFHPESNQIIAKFTNTGGFSEVNVGNGTTTLDCGVYDDFGFIGTKEQADFYIRTNADYKIVIKDATGNVGIGTFSPSAKLEVNGSAMKPGGGSWTATSDVRLKQNINPYNAGLDAVLAIRPVSYQYNALSGMNTDEAHVGVIAQELQTVAPEMVSVSQKTYEDGSTGYLQVDNSAMTYMLINAVKELSARVDAQQQVIDELMQQLKEKSR